MKKQLARTLFMWVLYGVTLWVGFGWFGLPNAFMPMFMTFLGTSVPLGFALWESFIFMGMNDLRKDARDAECCIEAVSPHVMTLHYARNCAMTRG